MTADRQTPQELIEEHQGLVKSLAMKIHRRLPPHLELDDLIAYGQVGLAEAARDYDPTRGGRFVTYAYYRVRGAIYDGVSKMAWTSRSRYQRLRYERLADDVLQGENEGASESADLGLAKDAAWLRDLTDQLFVVYLSSLGEAGDESGELSLPDDEPLPPRVAGNREIQQLLLEQIPKLSPESQALIRAAYFEGVTLQEAGRRLGLSKSWASRLHARALRQLADLLRRVGVDAAVA
jgi:RNA polymerase sigma factor for flagellar operon FliA